MKAIEEFLKEPDKDYYIACSTTRDRESKRSALFHARRRYNETIRDIVGIKNKDIEGKLFVVLYSRVQEEHYRMVNGELVPVKAETPADLLGDKERQIMLMKRDGMTDAEIEEYFIGCINEPS